MKIIVAGSGGREHAISWKLAQSENVSQVVCVPGNGGTSRENKCVNIDPKADDATKNLSFNDAFLKIAKDEKVDLAVIGPENPLADGIADLLWANGIPVVGPKLKGAELEASKDLSKIFMKKYGVACAGSETFTDEAAAIAYVEKMGAPIVIKADGLAAGKGVVVAKTLDEAKNAVHDLMAGMVGDAGKKLVIEEYLQGVEISILSAVSVTEKSAANGKACILPFLPARDHKRLLDGAKGPNTGGMGAVCPLDDVTVETISRFEENILQPTLDGMIAEKMDYRGFIFFGLMITKDGPKCLEYNVRLGDPETQAVLPMMDFDFAELCKAISDENGALKDFKAKLQWKDGFQVAPVAVSGGYPGSYKKGMAISISPDAENGDTKKIFIAGASTSSATGGMGASTGSATGEASPKDMLFTNGGRVLACSAHGATFDEAWKSAYKMLESVKFDGMQYRKDIGLPGAAESN